MGKGSTFRIYLPAYTPLVRAPSAKTVVASSESPAVVLVVEDEEVLREFANLILRKHGFQVLTARDGVEALNIAEQHKSPPDLVFTDVVMPRMDGAELSRRFVQQFPATPILFTSGYPRSILIESGLEEKGQQFLQKPYTTQTLLEKIREVLSSRALARS